MSSVTSGALWGAEGAERRLRGKDSNLEFQGQNLASCRLLHPARVRGEYRTPGHSGSMNAGAPLETPARPASSGLGEPISASCIAASSASVSAAGAVHD